MSDTGAGALAARLAAARRERGWSLREAERHSGVHNAHLSQIETGGIRRPELSILMRLASAYELPAGDLIADAGYDAEAVSAFAAAVRAIRPPESGTGATAYCDTCQAVMSSVDELVRGILEALCERDGIPLESPVTAGEPARNYELALRLGIGQVFGLDDGRPEGGAR